MKEIRNDVKYDFGDTTAADVSVRLTNRDGGQEWFHCHSLVLMNSSKFFADELSSNQPSKPTKCVVVFCSGSDYVHYVKILKLLYLSEDLVLDSFDSVKSALGILRASVALQCDNITKSCMHYLEAVPWEEKEEEEIIKVIPALGPDAMPVLARIQPVDLTNTMNVFIAAIRFATAIDRSFPPFGDELKTSAQEQVEYMLLEDEETMLLAGNKDVRSELKTGLANMFARLEIELDMLPSDYDQSPELAEQRFLQSVADLDWIGNVLPKMEMMKEFVSSWANISDYLLAVVQDEKYNFGLWAVKGKLIEVAGKTLEAIGYGNVVLPAANRAQFLKTWLPYMRKMKDLLDSKASDNEVFPYKIDSDICQSIEGAIVSLVLALPSNDQADILGDWMKGTDQLKFPDLSEAFEVWCYRTKTAKRRLSVGFNSMAMSLSPSDEQPTCNSYDLNTVT